MEVQVLELDLRSHISLAVMDVPPEAYDSTEHHGIYLSTLAPGGGLSLVVMSEHVDARVWERRATAAGRRRRWWCRCFGGVGAGSKRPSPASPIHDYDLLAEILLRLPLSSSLPRVSLVCTRWRRLVTDPYFLRRFRTRSWRPLGVFLRSTERLGENLSFALISETDAPKLLSVRVPPERHEEIGGGGDGSDAWKFCGCRHGCALLLSRGRPPHGHFGARRVLVWNPVSGEHHFVDVPPHLSDPDQSRFHVQVALTRASGDDEGPFKVALAWVDGGSAHACVYSSAAGDWGDVVSAPLRSDSWFCVGDLNVLVGNSLYWMLFGRRTCVLGFDLGSQNIAVIEVPRDAYADHRGLYLSTLAEGGRLSLISMTTKLRAQVWERMTGSDGVAGWVLGGTIDLAQLLSLGPERGYGWCKLLLGVAGDDNVLFMSTRSGVFMVHLKSMQFEKIFETNPFSLSGSIHQFTHLNFPGSVAPEN
ncbi:hypothetical protein BS78_05G031300 [Paspalum vaginatum]|nr:hypothetical protein BS78_05G031300 [Paspalum vaginatum]